MSIRFCECDASVDSMRGGDANRCHRLTPAMAMKHGFESVEEYKANVQKKFSLLENGILEMPSTRLLLVNVCVEVWVGYLADGLTVRIGYARRIDAD